MPLFDTPWKKATDSGRSEEVLAGMLTRAGRHAYTSQGGEQKAVASNGIALLRAGCSRPAVQHLHSSGKVGLGRAMELAGGDCSDLDSGAVLTSGQAMGDTGAWWGGLRSWSSCKFTDNRARIVFLRTLLLLHEAQRMQQPGRGSRTPTVQTIFGVFCLLLLLVNTHEGFD